MAEEKGQLNITGPFETTDIRVLDSSMTEVASGTHEVSQSLAPGIYRVIAQVPGARDEKLVVVRPGDTTMLSDFDLTWDSITPHSKSRSKHDYQTNPAADISKKTHVSIGPEPKGRLFLYVRTDGDSREHLPAFRIADRKGKTIASLPDAGEGNVQSGWLALSADLPAGMYQIEHHAGTLGRRAQAVFLEDGWETQMFVPWREEPDFSSAIIYMRPRGTGFEPDKFWEYTRVEAALNGLADRKVVLHPGEIDAFLSGKFEDPMLGLIGAYALLLSGDVNYEQLHNIASNLVSLVPRSPDAHLLRLIAATEGKIPPAPRGADWPAFENPPLFSVGTE